MLYITPTPIGNLDDITLRALKILNKAKIILCEDPRITAKLLTLLKIENKPKLINLVNSGKFNYYKIKEALETIESISVKTDCELDNSQTKYSCEVNINIEQDDNVIALVSDAGMPGISDPGFEVIELAQNLNIPYTVLPGATSSIAALVASNMCGREYRFTGFLAIKKGRQSKLKEIQKSSIPVIIFESSHRIHKLIEELKEVLEPTRRITIAQELTKSHESILIDSIDNISIQKINPKGEFVVIVEGRK